MARPEDSVTQFRAGVEPKPSPPRRAAEGQSDNELDLSSNAQLSAPAKAEATRAREKAKKVSGIELRTPQLSPKDLQDEREPQTGARPSADRRGRDARSPYETAGGGAPPPPPPPQAAAAPAAPSPAQDRVAGSARVFEPVPAPEQAVDAKRAPSKPVGKGQAAPAADPAANADADRRADKSASAAEAKQVDDRARTLEWARKQHDQVVALVSSSRCQEAAATAGEIYSRAPDYYNANIVTDRQIKPCLAYVNNQRERIDRKRAAPKNAVEAPALRK